MSEIKELIENEEKLWHNVKNWLQQKWRNFQEKM